MNPHELLDLTVAIIATIASTGTGVILVALALAEMWGLTE